MPLPFIPTSKSKPYGFREIRLHRTAVAENIDAIEKHKWLLSERVGRDVGMRVAALDYLDNIHRCEPAPNRWSRLKAYGEQLLTRLLIHPYNSNPASLVKFEHAMRGTRSLAR